MNYGSSSEQNFQPQDGLETIPEEEEPQTEEKQDLANQDTVLFTQDESKEEPFNTAIDDTSMTQPLLWANQLPPHLSLMTYAFQLRR